MEKVDLKKLKRPEVIDLNKILVFLISLIVGLILLKSFFVMGSYFIRFGKQTTVWVATETIKMGDKVSSKNTISIHVPSAEVGDLSLLDPNKKVVKQDVYKNTILTKEFFKGGSKRNTRVVSIPIEIANDIEANDSVDVFMNDFDGAVFLAKKVRVLQKIEYKSQQSLLVELTESEQKDVVEAILSQAAIVFTKYN
mgnify:CR=1 FL=1|jgi:hypothetical protein